MTPLGMEPATFRLVAQCLNQPRHLIYIYIIIIIIIIPFSALTFQKTKKKKELNETFTVFQGISVDNSVPNFI